jgi:hypothetical protein
MTPEREAAWQAGRLDHRCLDCGATSAASAWCYRCKSRRLEYRTHAEQHDLPGSYWCGGSKKTAEQREAWAQRRRTGAFRKAGAAETAEAVSEPTLTFSGLLGL